MVSGLASVKRDGLPESHVVKDDKCHANDVLQYVAPSVGIRSCSAGVAPAVDRHVYMADVAASAHDSVNEKLDGLLMEFDEVIVRLEPSCLSLVRICLRASA